MNHTINGLVKRPSLALLGTEPLRAAFELARNFLASPRPSKPGDGHPVVIFPGLGADGHSVATLRDHCRKLGYDAFDWGQGFNTGPQGDLDAWLQALKLQIEGLLSKHEQPATLIGWSLGGLYAREVSKLMLPRVRQVITIGTPFNADADHTNAGWLFRLLSSSSTTLDPLLSRRLRTPPPLRTSSIYSRSDGVVAWQSCRHNRRSRLVQDIEVEGSHIGMGWNREVLDVVTDRLGQGPGLWRPYAKAS
ncbi:alpha/beta fold hydrolase [Paucibacter sp. APW11]|uniref:Alpha/beta fold hydrolase n=1 Tax=Roseateles aquae TaxID=3077235 RepID=A0ABU3PAC5_9BURK|nr:alpha/beta fold hydrolase [Paucibacter sp. APW11]MDT8999482.1 alpha/beta fold hydrolase [Paucibacter sp. APW11]